MAVKYVPFDGELVSREWATFLSAARQAGVDFEVNEGHRTFARQAYFRRCYECQCCNNGNLAARPSCNAPHIRCGRIDHAIDSDEAARLASYGDRHGVHLKWTVRGEPWHVEASEADLRRFHAKHSQRNPCDVLSEAERKDVARLFHHRRMMRKAKKPTTYRQNLRWARWYKARLNARAATLTALAKRDRSWKKLWRGARRKLIREIVTNGKRENC